MQTKEIVEMEKRMQEDKPNRAQIRNGLAIVAIFIILRLIGVRLWDNLFGSAYQVSLQCILFLFLMFVVMSVGLVYFGFSRWVGIDLRKLWFDRRTVWGDIRWGLLALPVVGLLLGGSAMLRPILGLTLEDFGIAPPDPSVLHLLPVMLAQGLFFGFAIAAFQEETLFRGFLQGILTERFGNWRGNFLQAGLFAAAHIGLEPLVPIRGVVFVLLLRFGTGIVLGWLKMKRGTLLAPAITHGIIG